MTSTLTPRKASVAFRGFFYDWLFSIEYWIVKVRVSPSCKLYELAAGGSGLGFSLSIHAVAMTFKRLNVMHAPITYRGFFWKFAFFLIFPNNPRTASGHYTWHTVVGVIQFWALILMIGYAPGIWILTANYHFDYRLIITTGPNKNMTWEYCYIFFA
jgi:hypothetical protein